MATSTIEPFGLPPSEAIQWFREKGYQLSYDWRDVSAQEHARAFTVAKATQLDVLSTIRAEVDKAISEGRDFGTFKKNLKPLLQKHGWWGEREEIDPVTGEQKKVQLGSARRLRVIYDTNLRVAHAAGKWQRIQERAKSRPYLRYVARSPGPTRRKEHQKFSGKVWRVDDPIWATIYPPNGWGCACAVEQLGERDLRRLGLTVSEPIELDYVRYHNARTGETRRVPKGIDPGWDHNVGMGRSGLAPVELPVLTPTQNFADYKRAKAAEIVNRPPAPPLQPRAPKGPGKAVAVRDNFREVFGTTALAPTKEIADPMGVQVTFDERILPPHIARGSGREQYLGAARATVESPFEVWLVPYRLEDGTVTMRQRYIGLFEGSEKNQDTLVVVGHNGVFNVYAHDRIDSERAGYLLYSRPEGDTSE